MMMMMNFIHVSMYLADANWGQHKDKMNNEYKYIIYTFTIC